MVHSGRGQSGIILKYNERSFVYATISDCDGALRLSDVGLRLSGSALVSMLWRRKCPCTEAEVLALKK